MDDARPPQQEDGAHHDLGRHIEAAPAAGSHRRELAWTPAAGQELGSHAFEDCERERHAAKQKQRQWPQAGLSFVDQRLAGTARGHGSHDHRGQVDRPGDAEHDPRRRPPERKDLRADQVLDLAVASSHDERMPESGDDAFDLLGGERAPQGLLPFLDLGHQGVAQLGRDVGGLRLGQLTRDRGEVAVQNVHHIFSPRMWSRDWLSALQSVIRRARTASPSAERR